MGNKDDEVKCIKLDFVTGRIRVARINVAHIATFTQIKGTKK